MLLCSEMFELLTRESEEKEWGLVGWGGGGGDDAQQSRSAKEGEGAGEVHTQGSRFCPWWAVSRESRVGAGGSLEEVGGASPPCII